MAVLDLGKVVGDNGQDAKINGVNTLTIVEGDNITLEQEGSTLTINSTASGGTSDYSTLTNKPKINNVELSGNKTTSDLGISYNDLTNKPDLSNYITNTVNDLVNYYKKSETYTQTEVNNLIGAIQHFHYEIVQTLPATGANNVLYLVPKLTTETNNVFDEYVYANNTYEKIGDTQIDLSNYVTTSDLNTALANYTTTANLTTLLSGKQDNITSTSKLNADLVDDTNSTNKFVTSTEKNTWNGKQDALTFDNSPTQNSNNPVKSGGIYTYVNDIVGNINTVLASLTTPGGNQ